jgi:glycosyltransferase involved in cell wall biosynthesis
MFLANAVVVLTPEYREQLHQRLGWTWREEKVAVIPNGIDTLAFRPLDHDRSGTTPCVIGMAARMTDIKRQDVLIDAVAMLCARDGRGAWKLSLAGDGDSLPALRQRVEALGLSDVVSFDGYLGESELRDWFGTLDIYGHASAGETLSTSLLQAMAVGLPIVGSNVPGIANLLSSDGGIGLLAEQTPESFASRLTQARSDRAEMSRMGRLARSVAVREYSQLGMFERYRELLERIWRV